VTVTTKPRPLLFDDEILKEAADCLVEPVMDCTDRAPSEAYEVREALRAVLQDCADEYDLDGYLLARALEGFGWSPSAQLVGVLDSARIILRKAHEAFVMRWVDEEGIKPKYGVGDRVVVELARGGESLPATVSVVLFKTAQYHVRLETPLDEDTRRGTLRAKYTVHYEDAYEPPTGDLSRPKTTSESNTPA
jgi:hypothetical protein